jgi:hypothetical protein
MLEAFAPGTLVERLAILGEQDVLRVMCVAFQVVVKMGVLELPLEAPTSKVLALSGQASIGFVTNPPESQELLESQEPQPQELQ